MSLLGWRRRRIADFAAGIRPELRALPGPEPRAELLERILASRAAGMRVILPGRVAARRPPRAPLAVAAGIAVLLLLLVVPASRRPVDGSMASTPAFFGGAAFGQSLGAAETSRLPALTFPRAGAIHPLTLQFTRRALDARGRWIGEAPRFLAVEADSVDGVPAWRVTSLGLDPASAQAHADLETLYVARSDLRLLRRSVEVSPYSRFQRIDVRQQLHDDRLSGRMTTEGPSIGAGRAFARRLRPELGPYLSSALAPIFLGGVPLSATWQGRMSLLGWAVLDEDVFTLVELRVAGEDQVTVPAGTFDCWRLSVRIAGRDVTYWVRKRDGIGVRTIERDPSGTREALLTGIHE